MSERQLSSLLLDRGFLVTTFEQKVWLSDNACLPGQHSYYRNSPSDLAFLNQALILIGLEGLQRNQLVVKDQPLADWQVEKLFTLHQLIQGESGGNLRDERPRYFRQYLHGQKVPLVLLEPHVALLAKGLSAAGCTTYSACEGHLEGRKPLHVSLYGEGHTAWAHQLLEYARVAGVHLPDLQMRGDSLCECLSSIESDQRDLAAVQRQAIALGRYLYEQRQWLRQKRQTWVQSFSFPETLQPVVGLNAETFEFRVRLEDQYGYAIEFSAQNYRVLEAECRKALRAWAVLNQTRPLTGWYGMPKAGKPTRHVSIRAARVEAPQDWRTPWNDPKPVWLKLAASCEPGAEERILIRRRAFPKSPSRETLWLALWMGIREAFL